MCLKPPWKPPSVPPEVGEGQSRFWEAPSVPPKVGEGQSRFLSAWLIAKRLMARNVAVGNIAFVALSHAATVLALGDKSNI